MIDQSDAQVTAFISGAGGVRRRRKRRTSTRQTTRKVSEEGKRAGRAKWRESQEGENEREKKF